MNPTKIHLISRVKDCTLAVFYTESDHWQYRVISPCGTVFGNCKLFYTQLAAEKAGREWIG
jgi:hypothetical protein